MSRKIFESFGGRRVEGNFEGGKITSDAGGLLLSEVESRFEILKQFAACFTDYRNPLLTEHMLEELLGQRVYGLALGPRWSGRWVLVLMASGYPYERIFQQVYWNLRALHPLRR